MDSAERLKALERTRLRLERLYRDACLTETEARMNKLELEEEMQAMDMALDRELKEAK